MELGHQEAAKLVQEVTTEAARFEAGEYCLKYGIHAGKLVVEHSWIVVTLLAQGVIKVIKRRVHRNKAAKHSRGRK